MGFDNTFYHTIFVPALYKLAHPDWQADIDYNLNEFSLLETASSPPAGGMPSGARTFSPGDGGRGALLPVLDASGGPSDQLRAGRIRGFVADVLIGAGRAG